jgi:hypothetical protein
VIVGRGEKSLHLYLSPSGGLVTFSHNPPSPPLPLSRIEAGLRRCQIETCHQGGLTSFVRKTTSMRMQARRWKLLLYSRKECTEIGPANLNGQTIVVQELTYRIGFRVKSNLVNVSVFTKLCLSLFKSSSER